MQVKSVGPVGAKIMIVGDFPAEQDLLKEEPFIGGGGYELSKVLNEAGTFRESCLLTMVMNERVKGNAVENIVATKKKDITGAHVLFNGKHVLPSVVEGIRRLQALIELRKPNVVVPVGNLAFWALTGEWGVNSWRSSVMESTLVPGVKVIPTLPPARIMAQWSIRPLVVHDFKRAVREAKFPEVKRADYNHVIRPDFDTALNYLNDLISQADAALASGTRLRLGVDIETRAGHIACIAFAKSSLDAICIPLMCQHDDEGYWEEECEAILVTTMIRLLSKITVIGQNWLYDAQYIYRHWGHLCKSVIDTMIQQHSCFSNLDKNLAFLSSMYLEDHLYWKDDRTNWEDGPKGEGEDKYWIYNCTDACRTFAICEVLEKVIPQLKAAEVEAFQQSMAKPVLRSMNKGLRIDYAQRKKLKATLLQEIIAREDWLHDMLGREVNIKSPKQMQELFYGEFGLKPIINRKTKSVTTDDEALKKLASREPILSTVTRKIRELRSLGVFLTTFIEARADLDGRMRCSYNICGTDTYRFASRQNAFGTGLNLQNVPAGGELEDDGDLELPNVRTIFIPDVGKEFFDIDLDSADLRVVAWESSCKWLKDTLAAGKKPYVEVMREYFQNPDMSKKTHPLQYAMFKALCHGTHYLGTAQGISPRIGLDVKKVEKIQEWYFGLCPEIKKWHEEVKKQMSGRRWIQNVFGYKFHIFDRVEGNVFNQGVAWIPQSTVGCLINRAYKNIDDNLPEVDVLLQVHDSLAGQYPIENREQHIESIVQQSQIILPYSDPLIIPVGVKTSQKSWGDCE